MTISEIKKLCNDYGIKPSKAKGQNFLINEVVLKKIVASANLTKDDCVLEIGPGFGVLTEELIKSSQKVLSVELDKRLVLFLNKKFKQAKNWEVLEADILKIKNIDIAEKLGCSENYKIVSNLPYSITKPVLKKFLTYQPKPTEMVVLVQKEVAQKIVAQPGEMGLLSISVQFYGQPEIIDYISKESFFPQPKVESAILKIKIRKIGYPAEFSQVLSAKELQNFQENKFWQLVKFGLSSPRKQLQNNLANGLKIDHLDTKNKLKIMGLREDCRGQDLSLADWARLYQQFMV